MTIDVDNTLYEMTRDDNCLVGDNLITYTIGNTGAFDVLYSIASELKANSLDYDLKTMLLRVSFKNQH